MEKDNLEENQDLANGQRKTLEEKLAERKEARANFKKPGRPRKQGRPEGSKDKKKRLVRNPRREEIAKLYPEQAKGKMIEFEKTVLCSKNLSKTYQKLNEIIQNDDHRDQWNAMKFVLERVAHISHFEKGGSGKAPTVEINVTGAVGIKPKSIDGELED